MSLCCDILGKPNKTVFINCVDLANGNPCMLEIRYDAFLRIKHAINHPKLNFFQKIVRWYQKVILKQKHEKLEIELDNRKYSVFTTDKIWQIEKK